MPELYCDLITVSYKCYSFCYNIYNRYFFFCITCSDFLKTTLNILRVKPRSSFAYELSSSFLQVEVVVARRGKYSSFPGKGPAESSAAASWALNSICSRSVISLMESSSSCCSEDWAVVDGERKRKRKRGRGKGRERERDRKRERFLFLLVLAVDSVMAFFVGSHSCSPLQVW